MLAFLAADIPAPIVAEMISDEALTTTTLNPDKLHKYDDLRQQRAKNAIDAERDNVLTKSAKEIPINAVPPGEKIHRSVLNVVEKDTEKPDDK